ncbi:ABC transporter ATP-binding protein [bacterium]|nr:MAG: ABC transporter ATP-binding protein [bacterium]
MEPLLDVCDLFVAYPRSTGLAPVLNGIDFAIRPGESFGLVGESGSGKTVIVKAILGLLRSPWRVQGRILFQGQDLLKMDEGDLRHIRGKNISLTTADPRKHLNPVVTIGDQMANLVQAHKKVSRKEALARAVELLVAVGIPDPKIRLKSYPHELSGGMCQRVIIAMALTHSPRLILADEPTAGVDVTIARQILDLMQDLVRKFNSSLLLVSRDLGVVAHYCETVAVVYPGQIVEIADVPTFFANAIHPYSRRLLLAASAARDTRHGVTATVVVRESAGTIGCSYYSRCPIAIDQCAQQLPALEPLENGHLVRCFRKNDPVIRKEAI